jgi:hypothetical protein
MQLLFFKFIQIRKPYSKIIRNNAKIANRKSEITNPFK